jgi:holo-[acyl-carrier protein] synthase
MILGTGIDIVNIDRIERIISRWGPLFLGRVFTEEEIRWCRQRARPASCFALRFAAKEAFLKAVGWGLQNGIRWTDVEVERTPLGKPLLSFHRKVKEIVESQKIERVHLTLSDEPPFALAHVIVEGREDEGSHRRRDAGTGPEGH